ncbi:RagB/SusD family nutrient uptake outer membrane protein [uncultured Bacteroides sp.]|jgi:hypothetical protein|uniref:RagB/SusD family nutrient uptake outer membrane protein n=1 Tax=uncultured Bacteroides sp. TaxID=162156 RepID=UPI002585DA5B|nr:RagB/SusD family nutrient uptake outer membrane protein [uncultured Bacteroides sp.]
MKKIYLLIGIVASIFLSSCEDFLTTYPQNQLTAGTFFKTDDDFAAAANGMYSVMTGYPSEFFPMIDGITPFAGETATSRCGVFNPYNGRLPMVSSSLDFTRQCWQNMYKGIACANNILTNTEKPTNVSQQVFDRTLGEAYFIRGYAYFTLVTLFGDVPLFTEPQVSYDQVLKPRTPKSEVITQIIADFEKAKKLLPSVKEYRGTANLGRASKGAAQAFLGKVYVYEERWADAKKEFAALVDVQNPDYDLTPHYYDQFWPDGENGIESIYEIQYDPSRPAATGQYAMNRFMDFINPPAEANMNFTGGFGYLEPTEYYCDLFETLNGYKVASTYIDRTDATPGPIFNYNYESKDPQFNATAPYEIRDPRLKYTVWYEDSPTVDEFIQKTGQNNANFKSRYSKTSNHCVVKYIVGKLGGKGGYSPMNMIVMRYADVLLLYAETCIHENDLSKAVSLINRVRNRVKMPSVEQIGTVQGVDIAGNKENLMKYLQQERFRELGFEWGHMMFDMARWDILVSELKEYWTPGRDGWPAFSDIALQFTKDCYLFPIPEQEMTSNPLLKQNPGY